MELIKTIKTVKEIWAKPAHDLTKEVHMANCKDSATPVTQPASGDIILGFGQHKITIEMDNTPCKVNLSVKSPCDSAPVCQGDVNMIGFTIIENGFILFADIRSNTCCVEWSCTV